MSQLTNIPVGDLAVGGPGLSFIGEKFLIIFRSTTIKFKIL
jgi:hypothetical protein